MTNMISIKPHHFIDIISDYGGGQETFEPSPYGHAVHIVARKVLADRDVTLKMNLGADDICKPCKHNINGICDDTIDTSFRPKAPSSKREYNLLIDRRWGERLKLKEGDRLTAREFCQLLQDRIDDISDIYRENPTDRILERAAKLKKGIRKFPG